MEEHDASGQFVDVLPAVPAGFDKGFLNVRFAHAQGGHPFGQLLLFWQIHRERTHDENLAESLHNLNEGCQVARLPAQLLSGLKRINGRGFS